MKTRFGILLTQSAHPVYQILIVLYSFGLNIDCSESGMSNSFG